MPEPDPYACEDDCQNCVNLRLENRLLAETLLDKLDRLGAIRYRATQAGAEPLLEVLNAADRDVARMKRVG